MQKKEAIIISNLNKKFKSGYGVEDINFVVEPGKVFGYLGPNGAGKSTTIRTIIGFIKPNSGTSTILKHGTTVEEIVEYDSWTDGNKIQRIIGYVPGEIAFPNYMTGIELLKMVFRLRNMNDWEDVKKYIQYWEFDPTLKIKKMSKGMKQKLALCIAWMHNPDIIILDEPTTGLDPLMQEKFIALVRQSRENGKAILMSSHIFSEIEKTCDNVAIIKRGKIISTVDMNAIKYNEDKTYEIMFKSEISEEFLKSNLFTLIDEITDKKTIIVGVNNKDINEFIKLLTKYDLIFFKEHPLNLEEYFMKYYKSEIKTDLVEKIENYVVSKKHDKSRISFELVKHSAKKSLGLWIFLTGLLMLVTVIAFSAMKSNGLFDSSKTLVEETIGAFQMMLRMILGSMGFTILVIYVLICPTSLIATEVEQGTMVNLLTTNQSRKSVLLTKLITFHTFILTSIILEMIVFYIVVYAFGLGSIVNSGVVMIGFLGLYLILFFMGSISIFFSALFNKSAYSFSITGAIILISWILNSVSQIPSVSWLKYLSLNSLFNFDAIDSVTDFKNYLGQYIAMGLVGVGLSFGAYFVFTKKDLPL